MARIWAGPTRATAKSLVEVLRVKVLGQLLLLFIGQLRCWENLLLSQMRTLLLPKEKQTHFCITKIFRKLYLFQQHWLQSQQWRVTGSDLCFKVSSSGTYLATSTLISALDCGCNEFQPLCGASLTPVLRTLFKSSVWPPTAPRMGWPDLGSKTMVLPSDATLP